ncbi:hypothetical protein [Hahella chejuensis]|nr:hypothetical protein [Hahella chejuensis]
MNKMLISLFLVFTLSGCDSDLYNELFRNPYQVEIADKVELGADWKEFSPDPALEIINQTQWITLEFEDVITWDFKMDGFESDGLLDKDGNPVQIDIKVLTQDGTTYYMSETALAGFIAFGTDGEKLPRGSSVSKVYIKSDKVIANVKIGWLCITGK